MKQIINFILFLLVVNVFTGCKDEDNVIVGEPLKITASADFIELDENMADQVAVSFSWNTGLDRGPETSLSYLFKFDIADNGFETTIPKEVMPEGVFTKEFTNKELYEYITEYWNVEAGTEVDLEAKVTATVISPTFIKPEVATVRIRVKTYKPAPKPLYLIGDATPVGWDATKALQMTEEIIGKRYTWKGYLNPGSLKLITQLGRDLPSLNRGEKDNLLVERTSESQPDELFTVNKSGIHTIIVKRDEMKIAILPYENVWMVGDATPAGWDISNPTPMTWDFDSPDEFVYEGILIGWCELKMPLAKGRWDVDYLMPVVHGSTPKGDGTWLQGDNRVQFVAGGNPDNKWWTPQPAGEAAVWRITVNVKTMTVDFRKK